MGLPMNIRVTDMLVLFTIRVMTAYGLHYLRTSFVKLYEDYIITRHKARTIGNLCLFYRVH